MNRNTLQLVRRNWAKAVALGPQTATLFYSNLFDMDANLKPLFRGDMEEQGKKLMEMISIVIDKLDDLNALVPILKSLGNGHIAYGVEPAHYDTVRAALLKTLAQGTGDDFTVLVKEAWTDVYGVMAKIMLSESQSNA